MPTTGERTGEVQRLATYFRQHPAALDEAPEAIAQATGADVRVVRELLADRFGHRKDNPRPSSKGFQVALRQVVHAFDRLLRYPMLFVGISFVLMLVVMWLLPERTATVSRGRGFQFTFTEAAQVSAVGMMLILHMACYFRVAMVRYALMGGAMIALTTFILVTIQILWTNRFPPQMTRGLFIALVALGTTMLGAMYAALGVGASLLGAYRRLRREEVARRRRTRQELLQRLFEVEESLSQSTSESEPPARLTDIFRGVAEQIWLYSVCSGFAWGLLLAILSHFIPVLGRPGDSNGPLWAPFLAIALSAGSMATQIFLAYLANRPLKGALVSFVFALGSIIAYLIPVGEFNLAWVVENQRSIYASVVLAVFTGFFAGLGAMVEERAYFSRRRTQNAPEVLLAEMIELRRALNRGEQHRCVMVVDAARSSVMKSKSDPLVAEWSFRAYQEFLDEQVRAHNGRIHSTAGDGAVAAFDSAEDAFGCARAIQTNITDFNLHVNRLKDPFRLRIGMHCGVVSGELEEIQFAAVIDIAAHIEAASQIGGIAVTAAIADQLPGHRFAELNETIDDQRVLLALSPTLDPDDES